MAAEKTMSLKDWCNTNGYSQYLNKLIELEFDNINDLFYLSSDDLEEVCKELKLKFGKKSKFLQCLTKTKNDLTGANDDSGSNNTNNAAQSTVKPSNPRPVNKKKVSLVFVGETGVGKSTLLKSIEDYINGVSFEQLKHTPKNGSGHESQTQNSNQYVLSNDEWAVNIIDTPGIGDTRGVDQDEKNMDDITSFLGDYGEFNAVCILIKRGSSRLSERFAYIVNEIRASMPKDVNNNFITVMTRAEVAIPDQDTVNSIKTLQLPAGNTIPINNVAYEELDLSGCSEMVRRATIAKAKSDYQANQQYIQLLLEAASSMKPYRGDKIKQLKIKRDLLKEQVGVLKMKIDDSFNLESQLKEQLAELEQAQAEKDQNKTFVIQDSYTDYTYEKETGKITTYCRVCSTACHVDCSLSYGDDLNSCCASGSNGNCRECGHSMSNSHTHMGWKKIPHLKKFSKELPDKKQKWKNAVEKEKFIQERKQEIQDKIKNGEVERAEQAKKISEIYKDLQSMAIIGHNESAEAYMKECKKAIESATMTKETKKQRLALIDTMIQQMTILKDVVSRYLS